MNNHLLNDYFFQYGIFDEQGLATDAVKIFPEITYDSEQPILKLSAVIWQWNMYFLDNPNDINAKTPLSTAENSLLRYNVVKVVHHPHTATAEAPTSAELAQAAETTYSSYNAAGGKLTLFERSEDFAGTGSIVLTDGGRTRTFNYWVNFFKKFPLEYSYTESDDKIIFRFENKAQRNINLSLMTAEGVTPCLNSDKSKVVHTLLKGEDTVEFDKNVSDGKNYRYRLCFADDDTAMFFLLVPRKNGGEEPRLCQNKTRRLTCPFCFRTVCRPQAGLGKRRVISCQGTQVVNLPGEINGSIGKNRLCCDMNDVELVGINATHRKWQRRVGNVLQPISSEAAMFERVLLPNNFENSNHVSLSVIGSTNVGKSVFISCLTGIKPTDGVKSQSVNPDPSYLRTALFPYCKGVEFVNTEIYDPKSHTFSHDGWRDFYNKKDADKKDRGLLTEYDMPLYGDIAARTDESKRDILQRHPFLLSIGKKANLSLFDMPGECLRVDKSEEDALPSIRFSDGLILLVNADKSLFKAQSDTESSDNIGAAGVELRRCVEEIMNQQLQDGDLGEEITKTALAVVVCKFDMNSDIFDVNSAATLGDFQRNNDSYDGSDIQKNTDTASDEVERLIAKSAGSDTLLNYVKKFKYHKFFAVSSLGEADCVKKRQHFKLLYAAEPKRLEHVILWMLWQTGIIE
jgi:hypothetical protein